MDYYEKMAARLEEYKQKQAERFDPNGDVRRSKRMLTRAHEEAMIKIRWQQHGYYLPEHPLEFTRLEPVPPSGSRAALLEYIKAEMNLDQVLQVLTYRRSMNDAHNILKYEGISFPQLYGTHL